jgi:endonuclease/exonuclease/phosphatase family metal-dependent hydrolase
MPRTRSLIFFAFLILFCGGFLTLLFLNRNYQRPPPASAVWSPPDQPIRIVSYNILHNQRGIDSVLAEIQKLKPDVLFLQEVEKSDLSRMTEALGTLPALYHASENLAGPHASWGNAILSRHPLYDAGSIPNPGGGSFGVWATLSINDRKFKLANVHLSATWKATPANLIESGNNRWKELSNLVNAWEEAGSPPLIVGGDFNQIPLGNNYVLMTTHWSDGLKALDKDDTTFTAGLLKTRIDYFCLSREWKARDGGLDRSDASDHSPIWIVVGK